MLLRSTVRPWHGGRLGLLQARTAATRPRSSLVLCSKAPREEPSLHPSVRRFLKADPQLASLVKENPRLLQSLNRSSGRAEGGRKQNARSQARSYSDVATLLRSAISRDAATVVTSCAAFDRLRALYARNKHGRRDQLQAACGLALKDLLRRLPDADLRSLATLARAAYQLGLPVLQEDQRLIVSKFISLVTALQASHAAQAKPGPPLPKPGWVQVKLSKQGPSAAAGTGVAARNGNSSSSTASGHPLAAQPGVGELSDLGHGEQESQSISNFMWAILSNARWQLPDEQLAALMECVRLQPLRLPMHSTQILVGLVRSAGIRGDAAVKPYVDEGGIAEVLLN